MLKVSHCWIILLTHLIIVVFLHLVGDEEGIQEVVFQLVKFASENIDMTKHQGEHPRMGQQMWFLLCRSKMSPWKSALLFLRK